MQRPEPPEKPESDDCCGSGTCYQCVWDVYYEKRAAWRDTVRALEGREEKSASRSETGSQQTRPVKPTTPSK